jgi:hypothetical protein
MIVRSRLLLLSGRLVGGDDSLAKQNAIRVQALGRRLKAGHAGIELICKIKLNFFTEHLRKQ